MRRFFIILLVLLLPLNGWAATRLVEPCPMQMSNAASFSAMKSGCCEDHGQATDKTSNPCKPGQECQTGALHFTATPVASLEFLTSAQPSIRLTSQIAAASPAGVWRPPRL